MSFILPHAASPTSPKARNPAIDRPQKNTPLQTSKYFNMQASALRLSLAHVGKDVDPRRGPRWGRADGVAVEADEALDLSHARGLFRHGRRAAVVHVQLVLVVLLELDDALVDARLGLRHGGRAAVVRRRRRRVGQVEGAVEEREASREKEGRLSAVFVFLHSF